MTFEEPIAIVAASIEENKFRISKDDLVAQKNPKGEGDFVYVPKSRYDVIVAETQESIGNVERYVIWLVINSSAYTLNSPAKLVTPSLPWPREAPEGIWEKTNLNIYSATEAIEILF